MFTCVKYIIPYRKGKIEYDRALLETGEIVTNADECWAEFEALRDALGTPGATEGGIA